MPKTKKSGTRAAQTKKSSNGANVGFEEKLWQAIFETTRATEPDPVAAWEEHIKNLRKRASYLQEKKYSALKQGAPLPIMAPYSPLALSRISWGRSV